MLNYIFRILEIMCVPIKIKTINYISFSSLSSVCACLYCFMLCVSVLLRLSSTSLFLLFLSLLCFLPRVLLLLSFLYSLSSAFSSPILLLLFFLSQSFLFLSTPIFSFALPYLALRLLCKCLLYLFFSFCGIVYVIS